MPRNFNYEIKDKYVEVVKEVRYEANTYVLFLNSRHSVHGVAPREITPLTRRFINMVGEVNTHPHGGLFATRKDTPGWLRPFKKILGRSR